MFTKGELKIVQEDVPYIVLDTPDYDVTMGMLYGSAVNSEAFPKELVRRWNSQPALLAACELGLHGLQANRKALKKTAELLGSPLSSEMQDTQNEVETFLETAIQAANAETTQNKDAQDSSG